MTLMVANILSNLWGWIANSESTPDKSMGTWEKPRAFDGVSSPEDACNDISQDLKLSGDQTAAIKDSLNCRCRVVGDK